MSEWSFDMDAAPRSVLRDVPTGKLNKNGEPIIRRESYSPRIIAASKCGKVTVSCWVEEGSRWSMFNADSPPIAWMSWPSHPLPGLRGSATASTTGVSEK